MASGRKLDTKNMKHLNLKLVSLVLASALTACGGGGSPASSGFAPPPSGTVPTGGSQPTPGSPSVPIAQEVINGIAVPPDPGAAKDATLAGVDSDHNGIRDEIDRWIATKYGDKTGALEAIRMEARVKQKLMLSHPTTNGEALSIVYESMDVGGCIGNKLRSEGVVTDQVFNESIIRTYNTRERIDARKNVFSLAGMIVRDVKETTFTCPYTQ